MRLMKSKSKNSTSLYVIESTYENGVRSTRIVEKLGTVAELSKVHKDPITWANKYIMVVICSYSSSITNLGYRRFVKKSLTTISLQLSLILFFQD